MAKIVPAFEEILPTFSPEVQAIAQAARELVFDVLPQTVEVVWVEQKIAGLGTGPKKKTEHFAWIQPASAHVTLGFNYGAELPDPEGLLEGMGSLYRHVKLHKPEDAQHPGVRKLVEEAIKHRVPAPKKA